MRDRLSLGNLTAKGPEDPPSTRIGRMCKLAVDLWGCSTQLTMMIEEMAELTKAICKYQREGGGSIPNYLLEEIADVDVMLQQMRCMFGSKRVDRFVQLKVDRLESLIRKSVNLPEEDSKGE